MITIENILQYAAQNNKKFEYYSNIELGETFIGLHETPDAWFWWSTFTKKLNKDTYEWEFEDNTHLFFSHRYNWNNGRTIKGFKTGFNLEYKILEKLK